MTRTSLPIAVAISLAAPALAHASDVFPFGVHKRTLPNGLQVIVIPFDSPGTVAWFTVVRTGSRDEVEPGHSGFAHFFEHMMFRGTKDYPTARYNEVLKRMGADSNAYTTDDYTNYYIVGPASALDTIMTIESDRFMHLDYSEDDFKTEALAVLGEYTKGASNPVQPMEERLRDLAFQKHTYKHTTIGFLADIRAMPGYYEYSRQFFKRFYRPDNAILLAVGDVQPDAVFAKAEQHYGAWEQGYQAPGVEVEPPQSQGQEAHLDWANPTHPHVMMGWHGPAFTTEAVDTAVLGVVSQLLFSESAPLYQELVVDKQWVDRLSAWSPDNRDAGMFSVLALVRTDALVPQVIRVIDQHLAALATTPVDPARLERVKAHLRYGFALGLDSPSGIGFVVSDVLGRTGRPEAINALYARYAEVTPADVQRVAGQVFRASNRTVVTLSHAAGGAAPHEGAR